MLKYRLYSVAAILAVVPSCANCAMAAPLSLAPQTMPAIASVGGCYLSYNVEVAEVVGGKFWKPYSSLGQSAKGICLYSRESVLLRVGSMLRP